jgi:DeoR/GlpR family transcriptional regulator of sugar metabolism
VDNDLKVHGIDNFKIYDIQVISESIRSDNDMFVSNPTIEVIQHQNHHIFVMELDHLLTRSGLTYQEIQVQRLKVAVLPLDLPCCGPVTIQRKFQPSYGLSSTLCLYKLYLA